MRIHPREIWAVRQAALAAMVAMVGIRADGEDATIVAYRRRQEELIEASNNILAAADTESRELTVEERRTISDNSTEVERLEEEIGLRNRVAAQDDRMRQPQQRRTPSNSAEPLNTGGNDDEPHEPQQRPQARGTHIQTTHVATPATRAAARGNGGFNTLGHFAQAVRNGCISPGNMDGRLRAALTTYGSEGVGADGGFAVPPDFRTEIMRQVLAEDSLFSRCDATPTSSNSVTVPTDETTPWSTSGVRVYTRAEAAAMTQSKPNLKDITVRLHETYAFVPMTDELLEDVPMMTSHLTTKSGEALQFALNNYIVNGTGAGQMLGIMNSNCLVSVAAEASQTAGTIHAANIQKMWGRMPASVRSRAVWLMNQDVETMLMSMGFPVTTPSGTATGGMPLFVPPGGLNNTPYSTLLGRPVVVTEACQTIGTKGDIILAFLPGFFAPYKAGGVKSDVSMHLFFDQGITAFRWTMRTGGQPWLSAPIARKNGSNTLSHFVSLDNR